MTNCSLSFCVISIAGGWRMGVTSVKLLFSFNVVFSPCLSSAVGEVLKTMSAKSIATQWSQVRNPRLCTLALLAAFALYTERNISGEKRLCGKKKLLHQSFSLNPGGKPSYAVAYFFLANSRQLTATKAHALPRKACYNLWPLSNKPQNTTALFQKKL